MKTLRSFISSPGDVGREREATRRVIDRLQSEFVEHVAQRHPAKLPNLLVWVNKAPPPEAPAKARKGILRDEECLCAELRVGAVRE